MRERGWPLSGMEGGREKQDRGEGERDCQADKLRKRLRGREHTEVAQISAS